MISKSMLTHRRALKDIRDAPSHFFKVGEVVQRKRNIGEGFAASDLYHITARLPAIGKLPQYRIRSDSEKYERVATQDDLLSIEPLTESDALIERTFGHG